MKVPVRYEELSNMSNNDPRFYYGLRDDSKLCINRDVSSFVKDLVSLLSKKIYNQYPVYLFSAVDQIEYCRKVIQGQSNILSLDKWFKGDFNLNISRVFTNDTQVRPIYYNIENVEEFKHWLQTVDYVNIYDDDICSGGTLQAVTSLIDVPWDANSLDRLYNLPKFVDICDVRDFIPGAKYGGLVCNFGGGLFRNLYIEPNVNLESRMKITNGKHFTNDLKELWAKHKL